VSHTYKPYNILPITNLNLDSINELSYFVVFTPNEGILNGALYEALIELI